MTSSGSLLSVAGGLVHLSHRGSVVYSGRERVGDKLMGCEATKVMGRVFPLLLILDFGVL